MDTWVLGEGDVARVIDAVGRDELMDEVIDRLADGLAQVGRGQRGSSPARGGLRRDDPVHGVIEWMPHHEPGDSVTIKTVAYSPHNPVRFRLPTITATVARFDDLTGQLLALTDGVLLTALRTGAASAVASRLLASPDSRVMGVIGAGAQAVTQAHALTRVLPIERVLVYDIDPRHAATFADRISFLDVEVRIVPAEEVARADVISTVTSVPVGHPPVLPDLGIASHAHVNAVGSDLPGKTELPLSLLHRAFVVPDHLEQARVEGECQRLDPARIGPSLPRLCADPALAAAHRDGLTVFDSTGFALEDHLALDVFLEHANELGLGVRLAVERHPEDSLDPYCLGGPAARTGQRMATKQAEWSRS